MLLELNWTALIGKESQDLGAKEIKSHIPEEAKMLKQTRELFDSMSNQKIKPLIKGILEDEQHHHHELEKLLELLKKEAKEWNAYLYDLITGFP